MPERLPPSLLVQFNNKITVIVTGKPVTECKSCASTASNTIDTVWLFVWHPHKIWYAIYLDLSWHIRLFKAHIYNFTYLHYEVNPVKSGYYQQHHSFIHSLQQSWLMLELTRLWNPNFCHYRSHVFVLLSFVVAFPVNSYVIICLSHSQLLIYYIKRAYHCMYMYVLVDSCPDKKQTAVLSTSLPMSLLVIIHCHNNYLHYIKEGFYRSKK